MVLWVLGRAPAPGAPLSREHERRGQSTHLDPNSAQRRNHQPPSLSLHPIRTNEARLGSPESSGSRLENPMGAKTSPGRAKNGIQASPSTTKNRNPSPRTSQPPSDRQDRQRNDFAHDKLPLPPATETTQVCHMQGHRPYAHLRSTFLPRQFLPSRGGETDHLGTRRGYGGVRAREGMTVRGELVPVS